MICFIVNGEQLRIHIGQSAINTNTPYIHTYIHTNRRIPMKHFPSFIVHGGSRLSFQRSTKEMCTRVRKREKKGRKNNHNNNNQQSTISITIPTITTTPNNNKQQQPYKLETKNQKKMIVYL